MNVLLVAEQSKKKYEFFLDYFIKILYFKIQRRRFSSVGRATD